MKNAMPMSLFQSDFSDAKIFTPCCNKVLTKSSFQRAQARAQGRACIAAAHYCTPDRAC